MRIGKKVIKLKKRVNESSGLGSTGIRVEFGVFFLLDFFKRKRRFIMMTFVLLLVSMMVIRYVVGRIVVRMLSIFVCSFILDIGIKVIVEV